VMNFGKRTITVQGQQVELDTNVDLPITNIDRDMDRLASQMAWWASVWAAAERETIQADAHYRSWRAKAWKAVANAKPKPPEHAIKASVEADPKFLQYKEAIAAAAENVTLAKGVFQALDKKGNQLQSRGARVRAEIGAQGIHTPEEPKAVHSSPPADDRVDPAKVEGGVEKMKEINRKKRTKGN